MSQRTFIALPYSPWSEKARWALDHHRVEYAYQLYTPMLGEPGLRLQLGKLMGPVTVPALVENDGRKFTDSFEIAMRAEAIGHGTPLFPWDQRDAIAQWNQRSEQAMHAGRALVIDKMLDNPDAQQEALPGFIPRSLRPAMKPVAVLGTKYLRRKYASDTEGARDVIRSVLQMLRVALSKSGEKGAYVLGEPTYADFAMAVALQIVSPPNAKHLRLGPATREAWTDETLASEFADLLQWRDTLYQARRAS